MTDGSAPRQTLTISGPDGRLFELSDVPVDTLIRDVGLALLEQEYPEGASRWVMDFEDADGSCRRLDLQATLEESGVTPAGTLSLGAEAVAGGLGVTMMVDLATFLGTAVASGVAGNAAYDLLKERIAAVRERRVRRLRKREAIQVARACLCIQHGLPEEQVRLVGAHRGAIHKRKGDRRPPRTWNLDFELGEAVDTVVVFLDRSEPGAEAIKIYNGRAWLNSLTRSDDPPSTQAR